MSTLAAIAIVFAVVIFAGVLLEIFPRRNHG